jgi:hypothetical protein
VSGGKLLRFKPRYDFLVGLVAVDDVLDVRAETEHEFFIPWVQKDCQRDRVIDQMHLQLLRVLVSIVVLLEFTTFLQKSLKVIMAGQENKYHTLCGRCQLHHLLWSNYIPVFKSHRPALSEYLEVYLCHTAKLDGGRWQELPAILLREQCKRVARLVPLLFGQYLNRYDRDVVIGEPVERRLIVCGMRGPAIYGHLSLATLLLFLHLMSLLALLAILQRGVMMLACLVSTYVKFELSPIDALIFKDFITHHLIVEDLKVIQVTIE